MEKSMKEILEIKERLLNTDNKDLREVIEIIGKDKRRPLGKFHPSYWQVELTRGCNLRCGFCATRLFPKGKVEFMSKETWINTMNIIKTISPNSRLDLANAGEPTLNPNICEFLRIGREISPKTMFEVITNGTTLVDGTLTYKDLFDSGANIVFVDMYAPDEVHIELAKKSGYQWYLRRNKTKADPPAWTYNSNMDMKIIILEDQPGNWNDKKKAMYFSTYLNNLDWEAAKKHNIRPLENAPSRRCSMPFKSANVSFDGAYYFCCMDFMREITGQIGNTNDGLNGFIDFWLGAYMQMTRKLLDNKDRNNHPLCHKCGFTTSRGDIPCWQDKGMLDYYFEDNIWKKNKVESKKEIKSFLKFNGEEYERI
jgi:organic radical activating enzyme